MTNIYTQNAAGAFWKPQSFQIISPGFDGLYGNREALLTLPRRTATLVGTREVERDNITNFSTRNAGPVIVCPPRLLCDYMETILRATDQAHRTGKMGMRRYQAQNQPAAKPRRLAAWVYAHRTARGDGDYRVPDRDDGDA